jgi:hypothetical protein
MAKLCNAALAFFSAQPAGTGRNFTRSGVTRRLQGLLCCAARALFRLKSVTVVGVKQVLTGPSINIVPSEGRIQCVRNMLMLFAGSGLDAGSSPEWRIQGFLPDQ